MPPLQPRVMPEQRIDRFPLRNSIQSAGARQSHLSRRVLVLGGALALTAGAIYEMGTVLEIGGLTPIEIVLLVLFSVNFAWIALTFTTALAGFVARRLRRPTTVEAGLSGRTAVVVPTYNENPGRIFAAVEAMAGGVTLAGHSRKFDWFILSDTADPEIALQEQAAFNEATRRLAGMAAIYYRRRLRNAARKPGNIADFCRRWGGAYDYLLVLDADSLMEPATIIELARRMEARPEAGIIQTVPRLTAGTTLFARLQQFAGRLYGQVLASGFAWWTGSEGNYWGHNAIIRMKAFTEAAGLPALAGRAPFGGHILSHDFVEAALLRRAGWSIIVADDLDGSYEEGPPSIADMAARDRRWCQGNLQHGRLLAGAGFHWLSRFHLLTGIMSYLASPLWFALIAAGLALGVQAHFTRPDYFPDDFHLFPSWPVIDAAEALRLFVMTMAVLFAVKLVGFLDFAIANRAGRDRIGIGRAALGVVVEVFLSLLIAPILMVIQTGLVFSILGGRDSGWKPQRREAGSARWATLFRDHRWHVAAGVLLGCAAYLDSPAHLLWLTPAVLGLVFAVPLSAAAASTALGEGLRRVCVLAVPEEIATPAILRAATALRPIYTEIAARAPGLGHIAADQRLRSDYLALIDRSGERKRGEIDAIEAMAVAKINEARSIAEAISWLKREEQAVVIGAPHILERLAQLPAS